MSVTYIVRWLEVEDAAEIASVEARGHPAEHRMGEELIRAQLEETADGRSLSLGLYSRTRLVGFILAFVMRDRHEMASFFDAPVPESLDGSQSCVYVADYVVDREHRQASRMLTDKLGHVVLAREELRRLPVDAFSTEEYAEKWTARKRFFSKLGLRLTTRVPYHDAKLNRTLFWLCFERVKRSPPAPRPVESTLDALVRIERSGGALQVGAGRLESTWHALRPWWNDLLRETPHASVFQTWEYLRTWNEHFGVIEEPYTIVALRGDRPVAIAPMLVTMKRRGGKTRPCLTSLGESSSGFAVPLLQSADAVDAPEAIAGYLSSRADFWDGIRLDAAEHSPFLDLVSAGLRKRGCPVTVETGFVRHGIDVSGTWETFFSSRPASVRQSFEQAQSRLKARGELRFDLLPSDGAAQAIEQYFELESNAPDDEIGRGASASPRHTSFHRALATHCAEALGMRIGFLYAGDKLAAGLMGLQWRSRFYVLHTTRTLAYASEGASTALLGRFIQLCFEQHLCDAIEISASGCPDAPGWSTRTASSVVLQAQAASVLRRFLRRSEPFA
jgi:hypothetical protein